MLLLLLTLLWPVWHVPVHAWSRCARLLELHRLTGVEKVALRKHLLLLPARVPLLHLSRHACHVVTGHSLW